MTSSNLSRDEFDRYIVNVVSMNRKILLTLFDLELTKNELLKNKVEAIKNLPFIDKTYFFFEGTIDFKSMILILEIFNNKKKIVLLIDVNKENESKILKELLNNSPILRNDLWHNCIEYNKPNKYFKIISSIKTAYELFQNNSSINKKELFENCIKYLNICLDYFGNSNTTKNKFNK